MGEGITAARHDFNALGAGVCIPGGGPGAIAAAMGELRGLRALGLLSELGGASELPLPGATVLESMALDPGKLRWASGSAADNLALLDPRAMEAAEAAAKLFGEGGGAKPGENSERPDILPLLRRQLRKILVFANTGTPLAMSSSQVIVDAGLPPLFGLEWSVAAERYVKISPTSPLPLKRSRQVFDRATFDDLRRQLWNRAHAGATAMAVQEGVTVLPNPHHGIEGGTADLLWVYLHPVSFWYRHLHDTIRLAMELEPLDYALFPNYDPLDALPLNAHQVNLLAHLTSWNVASEVPVGGFPPNAEVVRKFLGG